MSNITHSQACDPSGCFSRRTRVSRLINSEAPNFTAETAQRKIDFHDWIGNGWAILFSHPKDFTPVCTTELGYMAGLKPEFDKRNCKVIIGAPASQDWNTT
jgi:alkyl hydroperoxide reductase subunit AhpC